MGLLTDFLINLSYFQMGQICCSAPLACHWHHFCGDHTLLPWVPPLQVLYLEHYQVLSLNLLFRIQYATDELWIPSTSPFKSNKEWKNTHFKKNTRYENIMFNGDNVLTPKGLKQVGWMGLKLEIHQIISYLDVPGSRAADAIPNKWLNLSRHVLQVCYLNNQYFGFWIHQAHYRQKLNTKWCPSEKASK